MKKIFTGIMVTALAFAGFACGGGSSEESACLDYFKKYEPVLSEIAEAFDEDMDMPANEADCKVEFDCEDNMATADEEEIAFGMALVGPLFTEHGLNFVTFVKDTRKVYDAICV